MLRTIALTATAMVAFAANSVLARLALAGSAIDDLGYTGWRLASGAVVLFLLSRLVGHRDGAPALAGSWPQAAALFGYALAFSIASAFVSQTAVSLVLPSPLTAHLSFFGSTC